VYVKNLQKAEPIGHYLDVHVRRDDEKKWVGGMILLKINRIAAIEH
jgi:hypothetical protein